MTKVKSFSRYIDTDEESCFFFDIEEHTDLVTKLEDDNIIFESAKVNTFHIVDDKEKDPLNFMLALERLGFDTLNTIYVDKNHPLYNSMLCEETIICNLLKDWKNYSMYDVNDLIHLIHPDLYSFLMRRIALDFTKPTSEYCKIVAKDIKKEFNIDMNYFHVNFILDSLIVCYVDSFVRYKNKYYYKKESEWD